MVEEVVTTVPPLGGILRRISWPAIFSGTLVALATELLFAAFGLFIGFTLSNPSGITAWSQAWYFVTAFCSLFAGGFVAARIGSNMSGSGAMHGAVTWSLTTVATFMIAIWLSWVW